MSEVVVSSYQTTGGPQDLVPAESISLNFVKLAVAYKPQKADGSLDSAFKTAYDFKTHAAA